MMYRSLAVAARKHSRCTSAEPRLRRSGTA